MKYCDRLPRGIAQKRLRCQAMGEDGERCKKRAAYEATYHGDPETVFDEPTQWVTVALCDNHLNSYQRGKFLEKCKEPRP